MTYFNNLGQGRIGWRSPGGGVTPSTLWNSIYAVYNADSVGSSSLKTSLFAAYNGESNANDSFGSNNGTAVGGLTYGTGKIGNAFTFNGINSSVNLGDNLDIRTSSWSYNVWFNCSSYGSGTYIFSKGRATAESWRFGLSLTSTGKLNPVVISANPTMINPISTQTISTNQWYMATMVIDRSLVSGQYQFVVRLYINGVLETLIGANSLPSNFTLTDFDNIANFRIGSFNDSSNNGNVYNFNGSIDAFNIWNRVLTQSEITELYNSGNGAQYITDSFYKPTADDALNTYNGTAQGGLTYGVGKVGTAFQFNGTNAYVSLPNNSLNPSGDFTISVWVKFNSVAATYINLIENYYAPSSIRYGYSLYLQSGKIRFATYDGSVANIAQSTTTFVANQWYQIVLSKKLNTAPKLYINGLNETFTQISGNISNNIVYNSLCKSLFGVDYDTSYNSYLNGSLDAINIWNKELTASEVTELYNSGNGKQYPN